MNKTLASAFKKIGFEGTESEWKQSGDAAICRELAKILLDDNRLSNVVTMKKQFALSQPMTKPELKALLRATL